MILYNRLVGFAISHDFSIRLTSSTRVEVLSRIVVANIIRNPSCNTLCTIISCTRTCLPLLARFQLILSICCVCEFFFFVGSGRFYSCCTSSIDDGYTHHSLHLIHRHSMLICRVLPVFFICARYLYVENSTLNSLALASCKYRENSLASRKEQSEQKTKTHNCYDGVAIMLMQIALLNNYMEFALVGTKNFN